jgi:hypothetical protein
MMVLGLVELAMNTKRCADYAALGQRVGYPIAVASTWEHFYCVWGEGPNSFCLEAAGNGFEKRSHDYYRNFRRPVLDW